MDDEILSFEDVSSIIEDMMLIEIAMMGFDYNGVVYHYSEQLH